MSFIIKIKLYHYIENIHFAFSDTEITLSLESSYTIIQRYSFLFNSIKSSIYIVRIKCIVLFPKFFIVGHSNYKGFQSTSPIRN